MSALRRYEVLLPLRFNDGQPVPEQLIVEALLALEARFGAVSMETQTIRGLWQQEGEIYRNELVRAFVDVPDLPEHREFFRQFKDRLKAQFRQLDIWLTTYPIDVI
jgi:hypothetical protein